MIRVPLFLIFFSGAVTALPVQDPVIGKLDSGPRYQYMQGPNGEPHLVDLWLKTSDLAEAARFRPDEQNVYHLFTRENPTRSQVLVFGDEELLRNSNYDPRRRTVVLLHGWLSYASEDDEDILRQAFLVAEDVNVIAVDWRGGADTINYIAAVINTNISGISVARFINWLNSVIGSRPEQYHLVGHSLGGHKAGIVGRHVDGDVAYITALDPAMPGWITNGNRFHRDDGKYTEVMHTDAGVAGFLTPLGDVDFYPNGGRNMPGCSTIGCSHIKCLDYFAESLITGGFTGRRCVTHSGAMLGNCFLPDHLKMGGLVPKTGSTGIYYLETNAEPLFSRG